MLQTPDDVVTPHEVSVKIQPVVVVRVRVVLFFLCHVVAMFVIDAAESVALISFLTFVG
jgi:hypothetical protein